MSRSDSILVCAPSWVGDAVMSLGAVRALRSAHPDRQITVLVRPWVKAIYEACEVVNELLVYDPRGEHRGPRGFQRAVRRVKQGGFQTAILFPNAFRTAALIWASRIPDRMGYATEGRGFLLTRPVPPAPRPFGRHQSYYYLDLLRAAGVDSQTADLHLVPTDEMKRGGREALESAGWKGEPLAGIHPGSTNSRAKRWRLDRYGQVADQLASRLGGRAVLFGGPGEEELVEEIRRHTRSEPLCLVGKTSLGALIGTFQHLSILVTNDSGPMHVAAAMGVPTLAVFGPTDERETGPLGPRTLVVREPVDCARCLLRECPVDHRCMERVTADRVYADALRLLGAEGVERKVEEVGP